MTTDAATARRKAMAEAIRAKLAELFQRPAWDEARVPDELAEAADLASLKCMEEEVEQARRRLLRRYYEWYWGVGDEQKARDET